MPIYQEPRRTVIDGSLRAAAVDAGEAALFADVKTWRFYTDAEAPHRGRRRKRLVFGTQIRRNKEKLWFVIVQWILVAFAGLCSSRVQGAGAHQVEENCARWRGRSKAAAVKPGATPTPARKKPWYSRSAETGTKPTVKPGPFDEAGRAPAAAALSSEEELDKERRRARRGARRGRRRGGHLNVRHAGGAASTTTTMMTTASPGASSTTRRGGGPSTSRRRSLDWGCRRPLKPPDDDDDDLDLERARGRSRRRRFGGSGTACRYDASSDDDSEELRPARRRWRRKRRRRRRGLRRCGRPCRRRVPYRRPSWRRPPQKVPACRLPRSLLDRGAPEEARAAAAGALNTSSRHTRFERRA